MKRNSQIDLLKLNGRKYSDIAQYGNCSKENLFVLSVPTLPSIQFNHSDIFYKKNVLLTRSNKLYKCNYSTFVNSFISND